MKQLNLQYNDNTILSIEPNSISFITAIKLKQFQNVFDAEDLDLETNEKKFLDILNKLNSYDKGSMFSKPNLGAIYKFISYYKRLSKLQEYILEKNNTEIIEDILVNGYKEEKDYIDFKALKQLSLEEEAINKPFYQKEDYLVIKTEVPKDQIGLSKQDMKKNLVKVFSKINKEKFLDLKNNLDLAYSMHFKNYSLLEYDKSFKPVGNAMSNLLSKLSVTNPITNIRDLNFMNNNLLNSDNYKNEVILKIYRNKQDIKPKILKLGVGYIYMKEFGRAPVYKLIDKTEEWDYSFDKKKGFLSLYRVINGKKVLMRVYNAYNVVEEQECGKIENFTLSEIPADFNENISNKVASILKGMYFEEFSIITEIIKTSKSQLDKDLNRQRMNYDLFPQMKSLSFNNKLFDVNLAIKKATAMASMQNLIDNGSDYSYIRFGVSIKTDYKMDDIERMVNSSLGGDIVFKKLQSIIKEINYPFSFTPFNKVSENLINLELKEISQLINLNYGETYFSGRNENVESELPKINNKHVYIEREEQLQSINLFEGPDAFNTLVIAASGGGKSFMTVNILDNFLEIDENNIVWIIDRGGSYVNFTSISGGNNINIQQADSANCVNPFLFTNYFAKLIRMLYLFKKQTDKVIKEEEKEEFLLLGLTTKFQSIDKEVDSVKFNKEKTQIISNDFLASKPQAILEIYFSVIEEMLKIKELNPLMQSKIPIANTIIKLVGESYELEKDDGEYIYIKVEDIKKELYNQMKESNALKEEEIKSTLSKLDKYIDTAQQGNLFNGKPSLNLENRLVNIDFNEIQDEDLQNLVLTSLLSNFFNVMTNPKYKKAKKMIVIDEAHAVLNAKSSIGLKAVSYLFRTARKHGALAYLISQDIKDFKKLEGDGAGEKMTDFNGIVTNAGWIFLLKKHPVKECIDRLSIPPKLAKYIDQNDSFRFAVKSKRNGKAQLVMSDLNYAVATTHKDEKLMLEMLNLFIVDNNSMKRLVLFSMLFGKDFQSRFQDINNFNSSVMGTENKKTIEKRLNQFFDIYKNNRIKKDKYIEHILKITKDDPLIIKTINSILILVSNEDLVVQFLDIIFKKMK